MSTTLLFQQQQVETQENKPHKDNAQTQNNAPAAIPSSHGPQDDRIQRNEALSSASSPRLTSPENLEKGPEPVGDGEETDSENARMERLGRERPAKFKTLGAELAFCYSIIASEFMAVSTVHRRPVFLPMLTID